MLRLLTLVCAIVGVDTVFCSGLATLAFGWSSAAGLLGAALGAAVVGALFGPVVGAVAGAVGTGRSCLAAG